MFLNVDFVRPVHTLLNLCTREYVLCGTIMSKSYYLMFQALPEQYHVYHINGTERDGDRFVSNAEFGLLVYRIPFTHPSHIPDIIQVSKISYSLVPVTYHTHKRLIQDCV